MKTSEAIWHVLNNIPGYTGKTEKACEKNLVNLEDNLCIDQQVVLAVKGEEIISAGLVGVEAGNLASYLGFPKWNSPDFCVRSDTEGTCALTKYSHVALNNPEAMKKVNEIIAHWETAAYYCESLGD